MRLGLCSRCQPGVLYDETTNPTPSGFKQTHCFFEETHDKRLWVPCL